MIAPRISSVKTFAVALLVLAVAIIGYQHHTASQVNGEQGRTAQAAAVTTPAEVIAEDGTTTFNIVDASTGEATSGFVIDVHANLVNSWGQGDEAYESCQPVYLDGVSDMQAMYLVNLGWAGDPNDGAEALYAPGC